MQIRLDSQAVRAVRSHAKKNRRSPTQEVNSALEQYYRDWLQSQRVKTLARYSGK